MLWFEALYPRLLNLYYSEHSCHLEFIIKLVEDGKVKSVIDRCYPLHEIALVNVDEVLTRVFRKLSLLNGVFIQF